MCACGKRSMAISDHIAASVRIQDNSNLKSTVLSIIWMEIWHVIIVVSCMVMMRRFRDTALIYYYQDNIQEWLSTYYVVFRKIWVNTQLKEGCGHKDVSANFSVRHLYWHLWQTFRLYHPFPIKTFIWCLIIWCLQSIHVQGKPYVHNVLFIENLLPRLFSYISMLFMAVLYYWQ